MAMLVVLLNAAVSSWIAFHALVGPPLEFIVGGGLVFGEILIRIDSLSAWFILIMNLTMITGLLYGIRYMTPYHHQSSNINLHYSGYILNHMAMIGIYSIQNTLAFLCVWEVMAISAFLMIIFEHAKIETLKAGINYLVQSHLTIVFLTIGFLWVSSETGSYNFSAIGLYSSSVIPPISFLLFICFFIAFAFKAGFVPFHTWLPYAHPAAPAHISGIMSGVIIKLGIFGILRMLLLIKENQLLIGYTILILSLITGIYGVMLAIIQHNLKKLLAYHSIENIGIIGIGIGLGTIGLGLNNSFLIFTGFAGALLHTFNHALFKSLLFYCAGTVYQTTHTMDIEKLGGLINKMPQTSALFLTGALAISGLPPLNGFISEFFIYSGLFNDFGSKSLGHTIVMIFAIFGLTIIGGMAFLCFTKAFSIVFLGTRRHFLNQTIQEADFSKLFPKYIVVLFIIGIGVLPQFFVRAVANPVFLFTGKNTLDPIQAGFIDTLQLVSMAAWVLIALAMFVLGIKKITTATRTVAVGPTWACGYTAPTSRFQYTANSFVRSYRKLIRPFLIMNKKEGAIHGVFPTRVHSKTHPYDKIEALFVDAPTKYIRGFMEKFRVLQNGSVQFYILYGVVFIFITLTVPFLINAMGYVLDLFRQI